jgi:hypothetical protein
MTENNITIVLNIGAVTDLIRIKITYYQKVKNAIARSHMRGLECPNAEVYLQKLGAELIDLAKGLERYAAHNLESKPGKHCSALAAAIREILK